jgi:hypothetical protein
MDTFIYREFYGPAPVTIEMDVYEMDEASEVIFHNYLVEKEGLHNTLIRFPQQYIPDGEHYLFIFKELAEWAGKRIRIQEHDRCIYDIIAVDLEEEEKNRVCTRYFLRRMIIILGTKTRNAEKMAT